MSLLHKNSEDCVSAAMDLFSVPPTLGTIDHSFYEEITPMTTLAPNSPIEFFITGNTDHYLDLAQTLLRIKVKVEASSGKPPVATEKVAAVNNLLSSLFSQIDISLNDKVISSSSSTYAYRSYIETLLNFDTGAKRSILQSQLWFKDTAGKFNELEDANEGYKKRKVSAKEWELTGRIHADIFFQPKYVLNGIAIKLRFVRNRPQFFLMAAATDKVYSAVITQASLFVRKIIPSPSSIIAHEKALTLGPALYPIKRCFCKRVVIPQGLTSLNQDNLFIGQLPHRVIVGLVTQDACNGSYKENPFNFQHFNLNHICLHVNGEQLPTKPYKPDFANQHYTREFLSLFGDKYTDSGFDTSLYEYGNGYTLYSFDLTPAADHDSCLSLIKTGNLRLEINFASALAEAVNVIVYAEFQNLISVDKTRNVFTDF